MMKRLLEYCTVLILSALYLAFGLQGILDSSWNTELTVPCGPASFSVATTEPLPSRVPVLDVLKEWTPPSRLAVPEPVECIPFIIPDRCPPFTTLAAVPEETSPPAPIPASASPRAPPRS